MHRRRFITNGRDSGVAPSRPQTDSHDLPATTFVSAGSDRLEADPLIGDARADLVIVGAGICGCSLALHAAEAGLKVFLLEAQEVGWGASGRNSGHLPASTKFTPQQVLKIYGQERGERLNEAVARGPALVFDLAEKHAMQAEVERTGILVAAHTEDKLRRMEELARYFSDRQQSVELLDRAGAAAAIGSDFYHGALLDRRGGAINPLAYVRGLARAAAQVGAKLYERSRAVALSRRNDSWEVRTGTGKITAANVALCTNAYTDDLWPGLAQSIVPVRLQQYVSKPLPRAMRRTILPGRQPLTDSRRLIIGVRVHPDGRFHFNGSHAGFGGERDLDWATSLRRMKEIWPGLTDLEQESAWTGWVAMNRDKSWKLHNPAPGLYAALGCNGRGVVIATLIGRELARHLTGMPARDLVFPISEVTRIPFHDLHRPIARMFITVHKLQDRIELFANRRTRSPRA